MANYFHLVVDSLLDNCEQITAFDLVFETNSTKIVDSQPRRSLEGVHFRTLQKMYMFRV